MNRTNEFGYPQGYPYVPFGMRDVQNKCTECGTVFVGRRSSVCSDACAVKQISVLVTAMREPMRKMGDALAHLDDAP